MAGAICCACLASPALAEQPDVSAPPPLTPVVAGDVTFLTGGVGESEQAAIRKMTGDYNVRITLTRPDGAFLSGVDVQLESASGHSLIHTRTRGPMMLVRLDPGRYVLKASEQGHTPERRVIDVAKGGDPVQLYVALEPSASGSSTAAN
jgi:hypothetical protein